jgi:hypothetical protein
MKCNVLQPRVRRVIVNIEEMNVPSLLAQLLNPTAGVNAVGHRHKKNSHRRHPIPGRANT